MISKLLTAFFGGRNSRYIRKLKPLVERINALESRFSALDSADFPIQTAAFRERIDQGASLDDLLPEAFALVREAGVRTLRQRHYDVQMIGGIALHQGSIAEMRTGEGKTLVATLAAYLNALPARGIHVVTVNDYLARRDAEWMGPLYNLLGLSVGTIVSGQDSGQKKTAYAADITYCTNNELGFDYLRDNMVFRAQDIVQRPPCYAIVDEVDSILIDEARTPLIVSGASSDNPEIYPLISKLIQGLEPHDDTQTPVLAIEQSYLSEEEIAAQGHYVVDEKNRTIELTERGYRVIEERLRKASLLSASDSLYSTHNLALLHHVQAALKARLLFRRDVDYLIRDGEVVIVDEHTGRALPGRRWSDGLHQAVEAKEGVNIQNETQTLASTTFQHYFRLYDKLAGMTGTADTEAFEFKQIYDLDVVIVPTNQPVVRKDLNDLVYLTLNEKLEAIVKDIRHTIEQNRPVLVGTTSVASSERLSGLLDKHGIDHRVLNAKHHQQESQIIAQAGSPGSVTLATNMAGRGTDIVLGGNWEAAFTDKVVSEDALNDARLGWQQKHDRVVAAGGLHVIGSERHESRRIDNQLRGRSGRQGDPGSSRFYVSLDDDLMRIFASDRVRGIMQGLGLQPGDSIEHSMVNSAIERAQRKVESRNFEIRKNLLEYDDVANSQRQIIYSQRRELVTADDVADAVVDMQRYSVQELVDNYIPPQSLYEQWDVAGLTEALASEFNLRLPLAGWLKDDAELAEEGLRQRILDGVLQAYQEKERLVGPDRLRLAEKTVMLMNLDQLWKEHLANMDHLRSSIGLRAYAQKQPKQEYKQESFFLFENLLKSVRYRTAQDLFRMQVEENQDIEEDEQERRQKQAERMEFHHQSSAVDEQAVKKQPQLAENDKKKPFIRPTRKVGRNEPCPCGSGKKYKHCHGLRR